MIQTVHSQSTLTMTVIQINNKTYIMKYVSLIALTLQNAFVALSMRHGRIRDEKANLFYSSTGKMRNSLLFNLS